MIVEIFDLGFLFYDLGFGNLQLTFVCSFET